MPQAAIPALITAGGAVLVALIERVHWRLRRVETKIDGLRNGTRSQAVAAIAELQREREELRLRGMAPRRLVDRMIAVPDNPPDGGEH